MSASPSVGDSLLELFEGNGEMSGGDVWAYSLSPYEGYLFTGGVYSFHLSSFQTKNPANLSAFLTDFAPLYGSDNLCARSATQGLLLDAAFEEMEGEVGQGKGGVFTFDPFCTLPPLLEMTQSANVFELHSSTYPDIAFGLFQEQEEEKVSSPATLALFFFGLAVLALHRRRKIFTDFSQTSRQ